MHTFNFKRYFILFFGKAWSWFILSIDHKSWELEYVVKTLYFTLLTLYFHQTLIHMQKDIFCYLDQWVDSFHQIRSTWIDIFHQIWSTCFGSPTYSPASTVHFTPSQVLEKFIIVCCFYHTCHIILTIFSPH